MIFFKGNEIFVVVSLIIIIAVLGVLTMYFIKRQQKSISFLHPGWMLLFVLLFYGISTPMSILLGKGKQYGLSLDFAYFYNYNNFIKIMIMYAVAIFGFFVAQLLQCLINSKTSFIMHRRRTRQLNSKFTTKAAPRILTFLIVIILMLGVISTVNHYNQLGGFRESLMMNRSTLYQSIHNSGINSVFTNLFRIGFLFYIFKAMKSQKNTFSTKFIGIIFLLYSLQRLITGSRLGILTLIIGAFFIVYSLNPKLIKHNKKKIIAFSFVLVGFFLLWQTGRSIIPIYLSTGNLDWNLFQMSDFTRSESSTGYTPGLMLLSIENGFNNFNYIFRIFTFFPSTLMGLLGIIKPESLSVILSSYQMIRPGNAIYTITLPMDIYISMGYFGVFIMSFLIYISIYSLIGKLSKNKNGLLVLSAVIYSNIFYIIRTEVGNWVSKLLSDAVFFFCFYICYVILLTLFTSNEKDS